MEAVDKAGNTPLMIAAKFDQPNQVFEALISHVFFLSDGAIDEKYTKAVKHFLAGCLALKKSMKAIGQDCPKDIIHSILKGSNELRKQWYPIFTSNVILLHFWPKWAKKCHFSNERSKKKALLYKACSVTLLVAPLGMNRFMDGDLWRL